MKIDITKYDTIAFDCDGIILDSNKVKTNAFYNATVAFDENAAVELRDYHVANGGISRFAKFKWVIEHYLSHLDYQTTLDTLLANYAKDVNKGLLECQVNPALRKLKSLTPNASWLVVSGGAQTELREIFETRQLSSFFERGIFGSPDTKDDIFQRELSSGNIKGKALFIGDSKYDFRSSNKAGLDFVFISEWTEVSDWREFCKENAIPYTESLMNLCRM